MLIEPIVLVVLVVVVITPEINSTADTIILIYLHIKQVAIYF